MRGDGKRLLMMRSAPMGVLQGRRPGPAEQRNRRPTGHKEPVLGLSSPAHANQMHVCLHHLRAVGNQDLFLSHFGHLPIYRVIDRSVSQDFMQTSGVVLLPASDHV